MPCRSAPSSITLWPADQRYQPVADNLALSALVAALPVIVLLGPRLLVERGTLVDDLAAHTREFTVEMTVRPAGAPGFLPPRVIAEGGVTNPAIDMSINGATYVSYTQSGDVKVALRRRKLPATHTCFSPRAPRRFSCSSARKLW